ncbi:MAG: hypothetical protein MZV65_02305 [Chromatiales bacterium]|nr:hypothetical protein [Chromatiales bacterium]
MATEEQAGFVRDAQLERLNANLARIDELSKRLTAALGKRRMSDPALHGPSGDVFLKAMTAYMTEMMQNPAKIPGASDQLLGQEPEALCRGAAAAGEGRAEGAAGPDAEGPALLESAVADASVLQLPQAAVSDERRGGAAGGRGAAAHRAVGQEARRVFLAPDRRPVLACTNLFGTNPDALERAIATDGESLVQGLENLVRDIEANNGDLLVTLADRDAFQVGQNLATTEGAVVYRNRMFELIQYRPHDRDGPRNSAADLSALGSTSSTSLT